MTIAVFTVVGVAAIAVNAVDSTPVTSAGQTALAIVMVLGFIGGWIDRYLDRKRREKKEDEVAADLAVKHAQELLATKLALETQIAENTKITQSVATGLAENTKINVEALNAANNVNGKMVEMNRTAILVAAATTTPPVVVETLKDINQEVHKIYHSGPSVAQAKQSDADLAELERREAAKLKVQT